MDFIFDIDGTLSDPSHRRHWVATKPKNWGAFYKALPNDGRIEQTIMLLKTLKEAGHTILIVTGRDGDHKQATIEWLDKNEIPFDELFIRPGKDYRADDIIKSEILDEILVKGYKPFAAFEDRKRVKRMWVKRGLFVFDVNQTDEEF